MSDLAILGIDPGTTVSGWVILAGDTVVARGIDDNETVAQQLRAGMTEAVAIERIEPRYGLNMGWETIAACEWVGRFTEAAGVVPVALYRRSDILRHLGVPPKANADSGVRAAMLDRWGGVSACRKGGPLYGVTSHAWAALAVAVCHREGLRPSLLRPAA